VINLRGESSKAFYDEEVAVAEEEGVELISIKLSAVDLPSAYWIRRLAEALETAERPLLIHCRAGADRTGVASVMAAMAVGGAPYREARKQLSMRYFHFDGSPEHIAGFLQRYEQWCRANGRDTGGWEQFKRWATKIYHPDYYKVRIDPPAEAMVAAPGERVTLEMTVTNLADEAVPAGEAARQFRLVAFLGTSVFEEPDRELSPRVDLPEKDVAPGESVTVELPLRAPKRPGVYEVGFDLVEEHVAWFAKEGSPVSRMTLRVAEPG
jgi:hypothetical protein